MCGRFNFTVEQSDEIREIIEKVNAKLHGNTTVKTGEVFPTNQVPILIREQAEISPAISIWGFPKFDQKGVIINARSETAAEKKTFRESLVSGRCIIPSTGFYEWDQNKTKYLFLQEDSNALYMAGLYRFYKDEMRFVVLTTDANESMKEVHHRMPLVLPKKDLNTWLLEDQATNDILHRIPPLLKREAV